MRSRIITLITLVLLILSCQNREIPQNYEALFQRFTEIQQQFKDAIKEVQSRDQYNRALEEKNDALADLLGRVDRMDSSREVTLLKAKIMLHLAKFKEALLEVESLAQAESPYEKEAKMVKVQALLMQKNIKDALALFSEIETAVEKNEEYYTVCLFFVMRASDREIQKKYADEILSAEDLPDSLRPYRTRILGQLATLAEQEGDLPAAKKWLREGITLATNDRDMRSLQTKLEQLELINSPAPAITAPTWLNGSAPKIGSLAGTVVVVEFWAPWCNPCRSLIPVLSGLAARYAPDDLQIIAVTRLYGMYRDDLIDRGAVQKDEELDLIAGFVDRHNLPYPVAVSHEGEVFESYGVVPIPTLVFINRAGAIDSIKIGANQPETIAATVERLLSSAAPQQ